jgi:HD-GYP domain-containing protein (c-di-GMP phosphodiesterase class II)
MNEGFGFMMNFRSGYEPHRQKELRARRKAEQKAVRTKPAAAPGVRAAMPGVRADAPKRRAARTRPAPQQQPIGTTETKPAISFSALAADGLLRREHVPPAAKIPRLSFNKVMAEPERSSPAYEPQPEQASFPDPVFDAAAAVPGEDGCAPEEAEAAIFEAVAQTPPPSPAFTCAINAADTFAAPRPGREPDSHMTLAAALPPQDMASAEELWTRTLMEAAALEERILAAGHEAELCEDVFLNLSADIAAQYEAGNTYALYLSATDALPYEHHAHVAHTSFLAIYLAATAHMSRDEQIFVGLAAFMEDIGIVRYKSIISKPGQLLELERSMLRKHPSDGAEMLRLGASLPEKTAGELVRVILDAHECCDGSGYPEGKRGAAISTYAQIVQAADIYQALTHKRPWRPAFPQMTALDMLISSACKFSRDALRALLNAVTLYPYGTRVRLSTGESGFVLRPNAKSIMRPLVKLAEDASGRKLDDACIDLSLSHSVTIVESQK